MKNRILTFIIGVLTGAIIITLVFMIINPFNGRGIAPEGMGNSPIGEMGEHPVKPEGNMQMPK